MADVLVRILGLEEAERYLTTLQGGVQVAGRTVVRVGTAAVYGWGIEFGRRRSGGLARRAGGAFMLTGAYQQVKPSIGPTLVATLPQGEAATAQALLRLGYRVEALAKARTPAVTGNLRRSLHTTAGPR